MPKGEALFRIEDCVSRVVDSAKTTAERAAEAAYQQERQKQLRYFQRKFKRTAPFYAFDATHETGRTAETNRLIRGEIRKYQAIADSWEGCLAKLKKEAERWSEESRSELLSQIAELPPGVAPTIEQPFLMFCSNRTYMLFFVSGSTLYEKLVERVGWKEEERRKAANRPRGCDPYDNL